MAARNEQSAGTQHPPPPVCFHGFSSVALKVCYLLPVGREVGCQQAVRVIELVPVLGGVGAVREGGQQLKLQGALWCACGPAPSLQLCSQLKRITICNSPHAKRHLAQAV